MEKMLHPLSLFVFWYPLVMSLVWIAGSLIFHKRREKIVDFDIDAIDWPMVSLLIPCFNEEETIEETIDSMQSLPYQNKEIIVVNDGSTDQTRCVLRKLAVKYPELRVIDCQENRGKASALNLAALASRAEYLVCVDSDALLDQHAIYYLIYNFLNKGERLGAVSGNPRIRNRDTLLSKLQIVEYASIIGAIKRAQRVVGKIMTVSGVVVAFRKKALVDVGLWDTDMITEDISISWKLQERFWDIRYETRALCWMLVPETLGGLWKQRIRWAQGGQEVILRHFRITSDVRHRRLWPIYYEQWLSLLWSYSWLISLVYFFVSATSLVDALFWLSATSFFLVLLSLFQLLSSLLLDSQHDPVLNYFVFSAWYPFVYWILNAVVAIVAFPKAIRSRFKGGDAVWTSPDRGSRK